jgi:hypothetical protein
MVGARHEILPRAARSSGAAPSRCRMPATRRASSASFSGERSMTSSKSASTLKCLAMSGSYSASRQ